MKRLIIAIIVSVVALVSTVSADSLIVGIGAKSDHLVEGNFNEKNHNWLGLGYRFIENQDYSVQVEGVSFVNSYYEPTKFLAVTGIWTPIYWRDLKLGVSGSAGYQKGYYVNKEGTVHPNKAKRLGMNNESMLLLYSIYGEIDNIVINYIYVPDSVSAVTIGFKAIEW